MCVDDFCSSDICIICLNNSYRYLKDNQKETVQLQHSIDNSLPIYIIIIIIITIH